MVYRFLILSDENEDFRREIRINADATFLDLNNFLMASLGYDEHEMTTFHLCDDQWQKEQEITLMDMSFDTDEESKTMADYKLSDLMDRKGQLLFFVFDLLAERGLFMELAEIDAKAEELIPRTTFSQGGAPKQLADLDEASSRMAFIDEEDCFDEFSDDEYDPEEIDDFSSYDEY